VETNWSMFTLEIGVAHSDWVKLGSLVDEYNECLDEVVAAAPESTARQNKEKELINLVERLRQNLSDECERFTRLIAILDANMSSQAQLQQQQQLQVQQPVATKPTTASTASSSAAADDGQDEYEPRGRQRSRSRTPQPSAKQARYDYSSSAKIQPGDQVAALVDKQWIIANVELYDESRKRYRVRDPEPTEGKNDLFWVPAHHVIPFFDWENDPSAPTFPPGTTVLAVWPESTELYLGVVIESPYRGPHRGDLPPLHYSIEFENSDGQHTPVPANQVVHAPSND